ncbi:hypothetical protein NN3_24880 [Nocardia neocaledoniensis NBRC 108232]|uniref:PPE-repeat protein n=1 Tax=Nocardia neocaledoniensis TaxID=236511 RepID=A0A317NWN1_9NOCA|nr:PPE domain-containing protein [Nocardia neocaledoniensis]PWV79699.1 PPE-repeat protein [Nocardia neocaledoniensis]GEM31481.1 hypothetical protein NN3_24880 [Nocardia neocaledoniensis NBRC 108232]
MTGEGLTTDGIITALTGQTPEALAANQGAATTRQRAGELAQSAANAAHDPEYIRNMEDFKSRPHQEIYDHAQQMQPGVIHASAEAWKLIGSGMQFATMALSSKVRKSAESGWQGASADAMLSALDRYVSEMTGMQDVANGVGWRLESAALAAEAVKASVPPPTSGTSSSSQLVPGLENPAVLIGSTQAASDGHQEAVWAMANHYIPNYQPAGQGVPTFGAPTEPGDGVNVPGTLGNSGPSSGSPQSGGEPSPAGTPEPTSPGGQQGSESAGNTDDVSSNDSSDGGTDGAQESSSGADDDSTTAAGADTGGVAGTPNSGSPGVGGGVPGSANPGSSSGSGAPLGSGAGSPGGQAGAGVPVAGRAVAGSPAVPGASGGAAAGGPGARAASGMGGMPGMAGGAGRRQGDQDSEHKGVPEWMINQRNTDELLGPRKPTTPAVFGIDAGPVRDGEWETVRRDAPEESVGPAAFAADQSTQDGWSAAPGERGERPR